MLRPCVTISAQTNIVEVTQKVSMSSDNESLILSYHPSCYKQYTAVKCPKEALPTDDELATKKAYIETRRSGVLPKSDHQGLLKGSCIFCRKKRNGRAQTKGINSCRLRVSLPEGN